MKREILFRAKAKDAKFWFGREGTEWIYGLPCFVRETWADMNTIDGGQEIEAQPETICEFTGLTDRNGVKIFEGDIVRYADMFDYIQHKEECKWFYDEIVYGLNTDYPAFDLNNHNFECNGLSMLVGSEDYFFEVIGNVYDNPELLGDNDND